MEKPVIWLHGEVKTPPFSEAARREVGGLPGLLQRGQLIGMPTSRPMPSIGARCHELRVNDEQQTWRVIYRLDHDAVIILEVFSKKTQATPKRVLDACRRRIKAYDDLMKD